MRTLVCLLLLVSCILPASAATKEVKPLTAQEIQDKSELMGETKSQSADLAMTLIDKNGDKSLRQIKMWAREGGDRLIKFLSPADVKGVGFLVLDADTDKEIMYLYLPAFKKVRRIAGSAKSGSFMGSDFSYDEIGSRAYEDDFSSKRLKDEDDQYKLELTKKAKSDAEYDQLIMWVSKEVFVPTRIEMYQKKTRKKEEYLELRKVMTAKNITKVGKYWIPLTISMEDVKKEHRTMLELSNVKVDEAVPADYFTQRYLQR